MKFECPNCRKHYEVPDEKLPPQKKVAFPCLQCKTRITLDLDVLRQEAEVQPGQLAEAAPDDSLAAGDAPLNGDFRRKVLRQLKELPPMPQIVFKVRQLLSDPDSEMLDLVTLLESDQAIATKVLKLANSAYYGLSGKVSSIRHASSLLGFNALGQLISMVGSSSVLGKTLKGYEMESADTWRHSLLAASASRIIAQEKFPELENDAFAAGLIHDVGKLVLDAHVNARKDAFTRLTRGGRNSMLAAEQHILGLDHAEIGFEVCLHWNIPASISQAIKFHHQPTLSEKDHLAHIVYLANAIANMVKSLDEMQGTMAQMDGLDALMYMVEDEPLAFLGVGSEALPQIVDQARTAVDKLSEEMQIVA